jgi:hypothetical protein
MRFLREELMSPEALASNFDLSTTTLADWRSQNKGPSYMKIGRRIWYPKPFVAAWAETQIMETDHGTKKTKRQVAFPDQGGREKLRGNNRFGRHRTQHEKGSADRTGIHPDPAGGAKSDTTDCGP